MLTKKTYALLRAATIPNDIHTEPDYQYLPESCLKNFLEVLANNLADDRLGWLFVRACKETFIPRLLSGITQRDTLKEAIEEFCELLKQESTGTKVYLEQAGEAWWLVREKTGVDEAWFKYAEMFAVLCLAELLRALTANEWTPSRIGIQSLCIEEFSALPSLEGAQFFIERPVTAVEIPEHLLLAPVTLLASTTPLSVPCDNIQAEKQFIDELSFKAQFTFAISPYLSMGKLPIKIAAEILRMNVRTLQRRLNAENIVYQQVCREACV